MEKIGLIPRLFSESSDAFNGYTNSGAVRKQNSDNPGRKSFSLTDSNGVSFETTQDSEDSDRQESLSDLFRSSAEPAPDSDESAERNSSQDALPTIAGRTGGRSRELFVASQNQRAYDAGKNAGVEHYDKDVYRLIKTDKVQTYNNHTFSSPGRYNRIELSTIYNSESFRGVAVESQNYSGLAGRSVVRSRFSGDIVDATNLEGVTRGALTEPNGNNGHHRTRLSRLTGEDPYHHTRALSDGARENNASGIRVPAGGDVTHLNIFPENNTNLSENYQYLDHVNIDQNGKAGPSVYDVNVKLPPDGSTPNLNGSRPDVVATEKAQHTRKGSARYGAAGAAMTETIACLKDGKITASEALSIGTQGAAGALTAEADDLLTKGFGGGAKGAVRGGFLLDGAVSAATSLWQNADGVENGQISAGDATADFIVDTGVGISSGLAGMAAGAALGSVVPIVGTAAGAIVGFAGGLIGSWAASSALEGSGLADWAREGLGEYLEANFEQPLDGAWDSIGSAKDTIQEGVHETGEVIGEKTSGITSHLKKTFWPNIFVGGKI